MADSIFRFLTRQKLRTVSLSGDIVDLGGARGADYHRFMVTEGKVIIVNLDPATQPDIIHDLEEPLPFEENTYDGVLLINLLEHVYHYDRIVAESVRILRPGGQAIVVVPFLYQIHAAPADYFRYTKAALERLFFETGFRSIKVSDLGAGICQATLNLYHRFLPVFVVWFLFPFARLADWFLEGLARVLGKAYCGAEYPIGYFVHAIK